MSSSPVCLDEVHALKCEMAAEVLRLSGTLRLQVNGWSMLPNIWPGELLAIEAAGTSHLEPGDIVLFRRDRRMFVHRVIESGDGSGKGSILTRGDAMPQPDPPVSDQELLGKVRFIFRNGKQIIPGRGQCLLQSAVASLLARSAIFARLVVGIREFGWA
jgi:signal peptidase I